MERVKATTIIMDFDNTLYDWVAQWYHAFHSMLVEIQGISGAPESELKKEIRQINQKHHTSDFAFLIENLTLIRDGTIENTVTKYKPAIEAFRKARQEHLSLYPGVMDTLTTLKQQGKILVVFTESQTFYTVMRFKKLQLEGVIDFLFTSEDHAVPDEEYLNKVRAHAPDHYKIRSTKHRSVGRGRLKPDPEILREIAGEVGARSSDAVYIGDSLYKDVAMAKDAEIFSVWAEYGEARGQPGYDLLREVSHWTDQDVEADRVLKKRDVVADATLREKFSELLDLLETSPMVKNNVG